MNHVTSCQLVVYTLNCHGCVFPGSRPAIAGSQAPDQGPSCLHRPMRLHFFGSVRMASVPFERWGAAHLPHVEEASGNRPVLLCGHGSPTQPFVNIINVCFVLHTTNHYLLHAS